MTRPTLPGTEFLPPPRLTNAQGEERRVGVELEFAAISARDGARLVRELFGGDIYEEDPHRFHVKEAELGDFTVELDTRHAHSSSSPEKASRKGLERFFDEMEEELRSLYGDVSSLLVPCEIVCPPIPLTSLPRIDGLVDALRGAGAVGTADSPLHAFGAQLNPEIATDDPAWLTDMLRAYVLLSDWLREVTELDATRRIAAFADPFPKEYVERIVEPGYAPDLPALIDDYLADNPTRNRELDMLPLFCWLDEERVRSALPDEKIHARPTFHYRLPNADLGREGWNVSVEWNRWRMVEKMAERPERLEAMGRAWQANANRTFPASWAVLATEWMLLE
ncbi:amidoligase family protein [Albimonas sp. CAU 1670]|uniref:amidoligase family protein n=1 Tax=Albimonas sp. CAU 1670 TaxID=3032599 RepID=UPI0023DCAA8C|nr:amidoligase family protein [Albimonas sp. CAU 1670]MDF2234872.1 amidoligase family protein [Albimonas sp. CAU 1670]